MIASKYMDFTDQHVLVIGSRNPWLETILLVSGARKVTTLEYGVIECEHPQVETMLPEELSQKYLDGSLPLFDAMVSFSSIEHSGLGRYDTYKLSNAVTVNWDALLILFKVW